MITFRGEIGLCFGRLQLVDLTNFLPRNWESFTAFRGHSRSIVNPSSPLRLSSRSLVKIEEIFPTYMHLHEVDVVVEVAESITDRRGSVFEDNVIFKLPLPLSLSLPDYLTFIGGQSSEESGNDGYVRVDF